MSKSAIFTHSTSPALNNCQGSDTLAILPYFSFQWFTRCPNGAIILNFYSSSFKPGQSEVMFIFTRKQDLNSKGRDKGTKKRQSENCSGQKPNRQWNLRNVRTLMMFVQWCPLAVSKYWGRKSAKQWCIILAAVRTSLFVEPFSWPV